MAYPSVSFHPTTPFAGLQPIAQASTSQMHPLGTIVRAQDINYGEGEFIYLAGVASTAAGDLVCFNSKTGATVRAVLGGATSAGAAAIAMAANVAGSYGWYQLSGSGPINSATVAANAQAYLTSTAGQVDDSGSGAISGLVFKAADSGGFATVQVDRPSINPVDATFTQEMFHPRVKRTAQWTAITNAATTFTGIGIGVPASVSGTPAAAPTADGTMMMVKYPSGATSGNIGGILGDGNLVLRFDFRPRVTFVIRTDTVLTSQRILVGVGDGDYSGVSNLAGLNSNVLAYFRFDTGLSDTNWMAVTSDGVAASALDTGVAVVASTTYTLEIDAFTAGSFLFRINNAVSPQVTKTTNLPTGATNVGPGCSITTLTNSARAIYLARAAFEQN